MLERHAVAAGVHDEPVQPGSELRLSAELPQARAELDEGLLRSIARFLEIAEQLRREAVHPRRMAFNEDIARLSPLVALRTSSVSLNRS